MGFLLLIASAVFLDDVRSAYEYPGFKEGCDILAQLQDELPDELQTDLLGFCHAVQAWLGTTSLGIIISVVQILFAIFALIKIVS